MAGDKKIERFGKGWRKDIKEFCKDEEGLINYIAVLCKNNMAIEERMNKIKELSSKTG